MPKYANCLNCGEIFEQQKKRVKCCSVICAGEYKKFKIDFGCVINGIKIISEIIPEVKVKNTSRKVKCICHCGKVFITNLSRIKLQKTKSCGCIKNPVPSNITHGHSKSLLYKIWNSIRQRCENPNVKAFKNYGAIGVKVCEEWSKFEPFYEWAIKNNWQKGLHIDKDKVGNGLLYSPETCCIITQTENNNNTRRTPIVFYEGENIRLKDVAIKTGVKYKNLYNRIRRGLNIYEAISYKRY